MKIGIAGYGYVGQAHKAALKDYHEILIRDPALGHYADLQHADAIIVCVSTPANDDGSCDYSNVYDIVSNAPPVPILIKSTISIEGWDLIRTEFISANLTFSPEFLRAATALEDFANTKQFMMGGDNVGFWAQLFIDAMGDISVSNASVAELILTKYFRNAFLATKVTFFNQMYDLCKAAGIDYDPVAIGVGMDSRIGDSHIQVTEMRGYGGHCFPKDMEAIAALAKEYKNADLGLINQSINYNNNIRKDTDRK